MAASAAEQSGALVVNIPLSGGKNDEHNSVFHSGRLIHRRLKTMATKVNCTRAFVRAATRIFLILFAACVFTGARPAVAQVVCSDTPEGRVCTIQQPIVSGDLVSVETQRDLGLVTVGGGCSGTLVNRYWVLTADHCLTTDTKINGPAQVPTNLPITAAWSVERVLPSRFVRDWAGGGRDVALIYLGGGDFGPVNIQLMSINEIEPNNTLLKFGRGVSTFAIPPATPSVSDGQGQVGAGGDSGGPDILLAPNGVGLGIAGVQSTCLATGYVPMQPRNWNWATGISSCNSASIESIRFDIIQIIQEVPVDLGPVYYELLLNP
jgi:hypothetical protein